MDEFVARVRAALRRSAPRNDKTKVATPDFVIDLVAKRVTRNNVTIHLTPIQWHLVEILPRNQNQLVAQRELLDGVWGPEFTENTHYLRVFIAQIRHKLEPERAHPIYFITEPGLGYVSHPNVQALRQDGLSAPSSATPASLSVVTHSAPISTP
jgi:two-component system, OmpR family, KDP operon response regulator KdpE